MLSLAREAFLELRSCSGPSTPPTSGKGRNGDYFLRTDTYVLWGGKSGRRRRAAHGDRGALSDREDVDVKVGLERLEPRRR